MPLERSLHRNKAALATSSDVMLRFMGDRSAWTRFMSRYLLMTREERVSSGPAEMAFTRVFWPPRSEAICLTAFSKAALAVPITL